MGSGTTKTAQGERGSDHGESRRTKAKGEAANLLLCSAAEKRKQVNDAKRRYHMKIKDIRRLRHGWKEKIWKAREEE